MDRLRSNLITWMGELDRFHFDVERAMQLQDHDKIDRLSVFVTDDIPPAVCSMLDLRFDGQWADAQSQG